MIFRNPYKEIQKLMKRAHNPVSGYCEHEDHVEVFVESKLPMEEIYTQVMDKETPWEVDDIAPEMCNNKPVKVVEIGEVWAHRDSRAYEPIIGGSMMRPTGAPFYGTLGMVGKAPYFGGNYLIGRLKSFKRVLDIIGIPYEYRPVVITNAHVTQLDVMNQKVGHDISQPTGIRKIGKVLWNSPFSKTSNFIDASVCSVDEPALINEILEVGLVNEAKVPRVGEPVHKYGATTKYTEGGCSRNKASVNVRFTEDIILPFHNIYLFSNMSNPGDSGSIITSREDGRAVSLLFAGSSMVTIGCDLTRVLRETGVEIGNEE